MLDLKFVRENLDAVQANLDHRHTEGKLDEYVKLYDERKEIIQEVEQLKAHRNAANLISQFKPTGTLGNPWISWILNALLRSLVPALLSIRALGLVWNGL